MLPQALKLKIIQQYEAGKLQKDIAHDLGISTGSVSTILKVSKDKQKYEGNSDSIPQGQPKQPIAFEDSRVVARDTVLKPEYSNLQIISQEIQNIQQQQPLVSYQEPHLESKDEPSGGCPLSRFILQDDIQPQIPEVNLDIEYPKKEDRFSPNYNPVNQSTTITSPGKTTQPPADIEDIDFDDNPYPDYDPDIYTDPDAEYDPRYDGVNPDSDQDDSNYDYEAASVQTPERTQTTVTPRPRSFSEIQTQEREEWSRIQRRAPIPNPADNKPSVNWDPDDEQSVRTRFFKTFLDERKRRQEEEHSLEEQRAYIIQERQKLEELKKALEAREKNLLSVEDLIPSAKYLKDIGIGFDQALVWIDSIKEVAQKERIDERTAAWKLAEILRSFKDLCGLEKAIQQATQQLAMLNMVNDQQKRAITTLAYLQQIGMTEDEIGELVKLVGRWKGVGQGSMNGQLDDRLFGVGH